MAEQPPAQSEARTGERNYTAQTAWTHRVPGVNPDGTVSTRTMAETLEARRLADILIRDSLDGEPCPECDHEICTVARDLRAALQSGGDEFGSDARLGDALADVPAQSTENEARRQEVFAEVPGGQHADHIHLQKRTPTVPLEEVIEECDRNADSQEPFLAAVFYDAATYLRRLSDAEAKLDAMEKSRDAERRNRHAAEAKLREYEEALREIAEGDTSMYDWQAVARRALTRSNGEEQRRRCVGRNDNCIRDALPGTEEAE